MPSRQGSVRSVNRPSRSILLSLVTLPLITGDEVAGVVMFVSVDTVRLARNVLRISMPPVTTRLYARAREPAAAACRRPEPSRTCRSGWWVSTGFAQGKALGLGVLPAGAKPNNLLLAAGAGSPLAVIEPTTTEAVVSLVVVVVVGSITIAGPSSSKSLAAIARRRKAQFYSVKGWLAVHNDDVMMVLFLVLAWTSSPRHSAGDQLTKLPIMRFCYVRSSLSWISSPGRGTLATAAPQALPHLRRTTAASCR
jgi:hypothetical protein